MEHDTHQIDIPLPGNGIGRVALNSYGGEVAIDVRRWWRDAEGEARATRAGLRIPLDQARAFADAVAEVAAVAEASAHASAKPKTSGGRKRSGGKASANGKRGAKPKAKPKPEPNSEPLDKDAAKDALAAILRAAGLD